MGKYLKRLQTRQELKVGSDLRQRVLGAKDWRSLEAVIRAAETACKHGELTAEVVEQIALMAQQKAREVPEDTGEKCLSSLFADGPVHRCRSRVLDEDVLFVADGTEVPANDKLVVYRQSELNQVVGMTPEQLRGIHVAKKLFNGTIKAENSAGNENVIWAHELLEDVQTPSAGACGACGKDAWWTKVCGERVCGVCHPQPMSSAIKERRRPLIAHK